MLHYARRRLRAAYEHVYGGVGSARGRAPLLFDDVRLLIHHAGLSQKQYAEKFVQIRRTLQGGYMRSPQPTRAHLDAIEDDYARIVHVWETYAEYRAGRTSIINLNLIMATLIHRAGGDALYWAHIEDFPSVKPGKWRTLFLMLHRIALRVGWRAMPCPCRAVIIKT